MDELNRLLQEYNAVLRSQQFDGDSLDYSLVRQHIDFLTRLDVIENSAISVFDLYRKEHIFVSDNYSKMLKYNLAEFEVKGNEFFNSKVHPEDFMVNLKNGIKVVKFSLTIPGSERKNYKLVSDYRVKNGFGEYIRIIEQQQVLELDQQGNIWLALSTVDISPDQDLTGGVKSTIFYFKTGQPIPLDMVTKYNPEESPLSKREREVLKLVREGLPSKEIAEKLFISIHTVNTHRQRILKKLDVTNLFEAIQYTSGLGLLD